MPRALSRRAVIGLAAVLLLRAQSLLELRGLVERGQFSDAERGARNFLQANASSAEGHFLLGYILFKEHRAKESLAEYTEGAKYKTPGALDLATVAGDYVLLKDYPDADKWFTKAAEWNPGNFQLLYYLGRTKYNENRFDEAVAVFTQCLKLQPKNVKAEDNLGLSYEGLGRAEDAQAAYRSAIAWQKESGTPDSGPYIDLGTLLVASDRSAEAVPYLLEALKTSPDEVRAHRELGKAYLHINQLSRAQEELETSVRLAPRNAPTHFVLAQVYRKRGLAEKARTETEAYTKLAGEKDTSENSDK